MFEHVGDGDDMTEGTGVSVDATLLEGDGECGP